MNATRKTTHRIGRAIKNNKKDKSSTPQVLQEIFPLPECIQNVLGISELLQAIFLQLDRRSLLTSAQRVCKNWRKIIATFPAVQQYLFFQQPPASNSGTFIPNPLLREIFPCFYPNLDRMYTSWQEDLGLVPKKAGFVSVGHDVGDRSLYPKRERNKGFHGDLDDAFTRGAASWQRMLVSQPPPVRIARVHRHERAGNEKLLWKMVEVPGGLTMGDLFDEVWTINWTCSVPPEWHGCKPCNTKHHGAPAHIA